MPDVPGGSDGGAAHGARCRNPGEGTEEWCDLRSQRLRECEAANGQPDSEDSGGDPWGRARLVSIWPSALNSWPDAPRQKVAMRHSH
jgi:hypothetical protein